MALIWPTENDVRDDNDAGAANEFNASTFGIETRWRDLQNWSAPLASAAYIPVSFSESSKSAYTIELNKGVAVINGVVIDFRNNASTISIDGNTGGAGLGIQASKRNYVILTVGKDGSDNVNGYSWSVIHAAAGADPDTTTITNAICVGEAVADGTQITDWYPRLSDGNGNITGSFHTNKTPNNLRVFLGFKPYFGDPSTHHIQTAGTVSRETYGFKFSTQTNQGNFLVHTARTQAENSSDVWPIT